VAIARIVAGVASEPPAARQPAAGGSSARRRWLVSPPPAGYNAPSMPRRQPLSRALSVALACLLPFSVLAQSEESDDTRQQDGEPAQINLSEKVTVAANDEEHLEGPRGGSVSVIKPEEAPGMPVALAELVADLPGVAMNGQGGLFQMVSVRGVSRLRVTSLISGMRLATERRAGVSISFVDPLLMGSAEVLRGPATTFYGSGALGGVMRVQPRTFTAPHVEAGYESNGHQRYQVFGMGGEGWSFGLAHRRADNADAADGSELNTRFTQYSAVARGSWERNGWRWNLVAVPTYGEDIGKSNTDFPERTTIYPREQHGLFEAEVTAPAGWRLSAYVHGQELETDVLEEQVSRNQVSTSSFDFGARWENRTRPAQGPEVTYGVESFNRRNVDAFERIEDLDPVAPQEPTTQQSLDGALLDELGAYATVTWDWGATTWQGGGRISHARQGNGDSEKIDESAWNGYVGLTWPINDNLQLRGNVDSGLRFPSLSELFYTGTTGRGQVIGNPTLDSERSFNTELSLRWLGRRFLANGVLFRTAIDDYVERVEIAEDLLTWVNLTSGTIRGAELSAVYVLGEHGTLFGSGHYIEGRSNEDAPLADIPPAELQLGGRGDRGRWGYEARLTWRDAKTDPGSGEKSIGEAWLLGFAVSYSPAPRWKIALSGNNLLDEEYFPAADRQAALAPARSVALRLSWTGR
jgi:iron complex outermembrane receptor protein